MKSQSIRFDKTQEPIILSKVTFDMLLATKYPSDCLALYSFYYYTAKWQETTHVRAVTSYAAKGLKWSTDRVKRTKKILIALHLIEDVQTRSKGIITGHYIKVNIVWFDTQNNHPQGKPEGGVSHPVDFPTTNAYTVNSLNACTVSNGNGCITDTRQLSLFKVDELITPKLFETFMGLYPNQKQKGRALTAWTRLCTQKNLTSVRPTWKVLRNAVKQQRKSEQWQNPKYIPLASNWLRDCRWLDDPKSMVKPTNYEKQTPKTYTGVKGNSIKYKEPIVM